MNVILLHMNNIIGVRSLLIRHLYLLVNFKSLKLKIKLILKLELQKNIQKSN